MKRLAEWSWFHWSTGLATGQGASVVWMNPLGWMGPDSYRTLSYVLLHSLWQGVILAAILWACLRCMPARKTSVRYVLSSLFLFAFLFSSCVTGTILNLPARQQPSSRAVAGGHLGSDSPRDSSAAQGHGQADRDAIKLVDGRTASTANPVMTTKTDVGWWSAWTRWVTWGWLVGATIMVFRVIRSLVQTRQLVKSSAPLPPDLAGRFEELIIELCQRLRLSRRIRMASSSCLNVPAVCGAIWPVLLMPTAMLTGIPLEQWRVILAHELAHVRRHDYCINVFQMLIEALFFFNPAVWWISRQMRREREACCDALAVAVTGQPLAVARALVNIAEWVQTERGTSPRTLVAWQSADGNASPGELTDRVKRIAQPESAPHLRMPWYSLAGILLTSVIVFLGLHLGSQFTVRTIAQILTPRERAEKLTALDRQLAAEAVANGLSETNDAEDHVTAEPVKITGTIVMADGLAVPPKLSLQSLELSRRSSRGVTLSYQIQKGSQATFNLSCLPGRALYLWGTCDGYAPGIVGPFQIEAGKAIEPPTLTFERGFPATIKLVDSQRKPIVGAKVSANVSIKYKNGASGIPGFPESTSDEQGLIAIPHAQSRYPYEARFEAAGFQLSQKSISFEPARTVDWEIPRAKLTTGQVVSDVTGAPVADAELLLIETLSWPAPGHPSGWSGGDPRASYATNPVMARTNAEGRYLLNTLADGVQYRLYVRSKTHRPLVLDDVVAGEARPVTRLLPPLVVKGRILGANKLPKGMPDDKDDTRTLSFGNELRASGSGTMYSSGIRFPVKIVDGVGYFELRELFPTPLTLIFGSRQERIELEKSIDDLVIDLNRGPEPVKEPERRKVIFNVIGVPDPTLVSGKLQVTSRGAGAPYQTVLLPLKDGKLELELSIGAYVSVSTTHLIGCWVSRIPDFAIADGSGPVSIDLPAVPAGAIQGRVFNQNGAPCSEFDVSVIIAKTPENMGQESLLNIEPRESGSGKFLIQQLPLGGAYRVLIRSRELTSLATLLSEPVNVDEQTPIQPVDLTFVDGDRFVVRVRDVEGRPAANVGVRFEYSLSGDRASHGFNKVISTNGAGDAVFEHVNWKTASSHRVVIDPTKTLQGLSIDLDPSESELTLQLKQGVSISGTVIDAATGIAAPQITLRFAPKDRMRPGYSDWIETKTNAMGEFRLENLEPREYQIYVDGADPVGTVYRTQPNGGYSVTRGSEFPTIEAGATDPIRIKVQLRPQRR